jgi:hypothetical protein
MIDITGQLDAITMAVDKEHRGTGEVVSVQMQRSYQGPDDDVWLALTDCEPEPVPRQRLPSTARWRGSTLEHRSLPGGHNANPAGRLWSADSGHRARRRVRRDQKRP